MQYTLILTANEIKIISQILQEGPYKMVAQLLDNIGKQVDLQNQPKVEEKPIEKT